MLIRSDIRDSYCKSRTGETYADANTEEVHRSAESEYPLITINQSQTCYLAPNFQKQPF